MDTSFFASGLKCKTKWSIDKSNQVIKKEIGKRKAVDKETEQIHRAGRPVLVGTAREVKRE